MTQHEQFNDICVRINECQRCLLHKNIRNYVPGVLGTKQPELILLGEAPGFEEDLESIPFIGKSGKILWKKMKEIFNLEYGECSVLNSLNCRPPDNRTPTFQEKNACYPWLQEKLMVIKPKMIITLGLSGIQAILRRSDGSLKDYRDRYYTCLNTGCHVVPTYHPMATQYVKARERDFTEDLESIKDGSYISNRKEEKALICHTIQEICG